MFVLKGSVKIYDKRISCPFQNIVLTKNFLNASFNYDFRFSEVFHDIGRLGRSMYSLADFSKSSQSDGLFYYKIISLYEL